VNFSPYNVCRSSNDVGLYSDILRQVIDLLKREIYVVVDADLVYRVMIIH